MREAEARSTPAPDLTLPTVIINTVPSNGIFEYGKDSMEKRNMIISFSASDAPRLTKLTIKDMVEIVRLDLKGCVNLEKLSFKNSKWESVQGVQDCVKLKKVSVKDCDDVSLAFLAGTNVQEVKVL